jgi:hypothetical protein
MSIVYFHFFFSLVVMIGKQTYLDGLFEAFFFFFGEPYLEYPHELKSEQEKEPRRSSLDRISVLYRSCLERGDKVKFRNVSQTSFLSFCLMLKLPSNVECLSFVATSGECPRRAQTSWLMQMLLIS